MHYFTLYYFRALAGVLLFFFTYHFTVSKIFFAAILILWPLSVFAWEIETQFVSKLLSMPSDSEKIQK